MQWSNMLLIFTTLEVSKLNISNITNDSQYLNMEFINWTFEVIKVLGNSIFFNDLQKENIFPIFTTFEVLKFFIFNEFNKLQLENIYVIFSTFSVLKFDKSRFVKE